MSKLFVLSFGEFWDGFTYFGILTTLVLYATNVLQLNVTQSYAIYSIFAALIFALPVIGGILADQVIGYHRAMIAGAIALIAGNLCLMLANQNVFILGLVLIVSGVGLYKSNATNLVGLLFTGADQHSKRNHAYTFFYAMMNLGAILGPVCYGVISHTLGWSVAFGFAAFGVFIGLLLFFYRRHDLPNITTAIQTSTIFLLIVAGASLIVIIFITMLNPNVFPYILVLLWLFLGLIFILLIIRNNKKFSTVLLTLLILYALGMCFFAASLQIGSSITLFIQHYVHRQVDGITIPTPVLTALDPFFVVVMAPVFTVIWSVCRNKNKEPSVIIKVFIGLLMASLAFLMFILAAKCSGHGVSKLQLFWIVLANLFLGGGEVCLAPAILNTISHIAPERFKSTFIGIWFLFIAMGGCISGFIASISLPSQTTSRIIIPTLNSFIHTFWLVCIMSIIVAIIALLLNPLLAKRLST